MESKTKVKQYDDISSSLTAAISMARFRWRRIAFSSIPAKERA